VGGTNLLNCKNQPQVAAPGAIGEFSALFAHPRRTH
jgi:hypothetical protein